MSYNPVKTMLLDSVLITRHCKALLTHSVQWTRLTLATRPPQLKDMAYKRLTSTNQLISQLLPGLFANNTKMISTVLTKKVISIVTMNAEQTRCLCLFSRFPTFPGFDSIPVVCKPAFLDSNVHQSFAIWSWCHP